MPFIDRVRGFGRSSLAQQHLPSFRSCNSRKHVSRSLSVMCNRTHAGWTGLAYWKKCAFLTLLIVAPSVNVSSVRLLITDRPSASDKGGDARCSITSMPELRSVAQYARRDVFNLVATAAPSLVQGGGVCSDHVDEGALATNASRVFEMSPKAEG